VNDNKVAEDEARPVGQHDRDLTIVGPRPQLQGGVVLKSIAVSGILALATLGASAPLAAQTRSAVSSTELESAVLKAPATNRETVQRFLRDSRVTEIAKKMGIQTADLAAGVSTLDEATLSQVAERTRAADRDLAGGDTVVISTTVIIIVLLILILLLK